jgi:hypothetical protein
VVVIDNTEKLLRLTEVSEEACAIRMLATKLEPVGEELERDSQPSPYDDAVVRPAEDKDREQARAAQMSETGADITRAVSELRDLAERVERRIGEARSLVRDQTAD